MSGQGFTVGIVVAAYEWIAAIWLIVLAVTAFHAVNSPACDAAPIRHNDLHRQDSIPTVTIAGFRCIKTRSMKKRIGRSQTSPTSHAIGVDYPRSSATRGSDRPGQNPPYPCFQNALRIACGTDSVRQTNGPVGFLGIAVNA
jgi:hypothetical protein